jgi:hypothetical protein
MKTHYNCKGYISITTKENKYDIVKVQKRVHGDSTEASDDFHNLLNQFKKIMIDAHGKENVDTSYTCIESITIPNQI